MRRLCLTLVLSSMTAGAQAEGWQRENSRSGLTLTDRQVRSVSVLRRDEPLFVEPNRNSARRGAAARGARLPVFALARGGGCEARWFAVGALAWICEEGAEASATLAAAGAPLASSGDGLPYAYYFVGADGSLGYSDLATAEEGVPDAQLLRGFGVAVTREGRKPGGERFGLTTKGYWLPLRDLARVNAPEFHGVSMGGKLDVAWVKSERAVPRVTPAGARSGAALAVQSPVRVFEERAWRGEAWVRVGEGQWLKRDELALPSSPEPLPAELRAGERWLDVELASQVLTAYVGDEPVFATLVSSGRGREPSELATPRGVHRLWVKLSASDMDNLENTEARESYAIQAVPWVMYFDRGYGLHGTFWHHAFGRVQSHGCVNLSPRDAERLFAWTSPRLPNGWSAVLPTAYERGTLVRVR